RVNVNGKNGRGSVLGPVAEGGSHRVAGKFGAAVFVEGALVIEGTGTADGAAAGVGAGIAEVPEADARVALVGNGLVTGAREVVVLELLGVEIALLVAPAVEGFAADFGDEKRLVIEVALL